MQPQKSNVIRVKCNFVSAGKSNFPHFLNSSSLHLLEENCCVKKRTKTPPTTVVLKKIPHLTLVIPNKSRWHFNVVLYAFCCAKTFLSFILLYFNSIESHTNHTEPTETILRVNFSNCCSLGCCLQFIT